MTDALRDAPTLQERAIKYATDAGYGKDGPNFNRVFYAFCAGFSEAAALASPTEGAAPPIDDEAAWIETLQPDYRAAQPAPTDDMVSKKEVCRLMNGLIEGGALPDASLELLRDLLASLPPAQPVPEPVAWMTHHDEPMLFPSRAEAATYCDDDEVPMPLYAAPVTAQPVPEGVSRLTDWHAAGLDYALAVALDPQPEDSPEWTMTDIAKAFATGARAALASRQGVSLTDEQIIEIAGRIEWGRFPVERRALCEFARAALAIQGVGGEKNDHG